MNESWSSKSDSSAQSNYKVIILHLMGIEDDQNGHKMNASYNELLDIVHDLYDEFKSLIEKHNPLI